MLRAILILLIFSATAAADSRTEKIEALMRAQGLLEMFQQQLDMGQRQSEVEARSALDQMMSQLNPTDEFRARFDAAFHKFIAAVSNPWSAQEIVSVWSGFYGDQFSDAELDELLQYYTSALGKKEVAASKLALVQFTEHFTNAGKPIMESALSEYIADLKLIASQCKCVRSNQPMERRER